MPVTPAWRSLDLPIRVGISSCLLGDEVRYDGGHQKDAYITGALARFFKKRLSPVEKRERSGVTRFDVAPVRDQLYLRPHPKELMLRNHA